MHLLTPGGWGHSRHLRALRDPDYDHATQKHPVREKHAGDRGWRADEEAGVLRRDYASYEEYKTHQGLKFHEILKLHGGLSNRVVFQYRMTFYRRFRHLVPLLPSRASIMCAGARQGTEVEVLRDLGFENAYGIDLNPGPSNPLVRTGDFMKLQEATGSVDLVYSNCVDHAFDLGQFFAEHARVVKPEGYALYDLAVMAEGSKGAFEAVSWKRTEDLLIRILDHFEHIRLLSRERDWMWVLVQGPRHRQN